VSSRGACALEMCAPPWAPDGLPGSWQVYMSGVALARSAPVAARRRAGMVLHDWKVPAAASDNVLLLLCELVTNAVKFGRPPYGEAPDGIGLALWLHDGRVVIEVTDESGTLPFLRDAGPDDENGRGLRLVEALSERWGYYLPGPGRKTVYCVVPLDCGERTGE
jgi:anti-sigma regulatory factor (Ser/Thr protein kinase)